MSDPNAISLGSATLLGTLQGLTEFLPVSSSGHLALAGHLLGTRQEDITLEILVHIATLTAVVAYYWRDVWDLVRFWSMEIWTKPDRFSDPRWTLGLAIFLGTLATGAVAMPFKDALESIFDMPRLVGLMLIVTAGLLASTLLRRGAESTGRDVTLWTALIIGAVQGLAVTPGISRSGSTIAVALLLGLGRAQAARFSFLLSIPAILGAALLHAKDFEGITISTGAMVASFVSAAGVGLLALWLLVGFVKRGRLAVFAPYCAVVGLLAVVFLG